MDPRTAHKAAFELLATDILGERQSLDSELGIHHRLLVWGKLISAQSGRSNILKVVLGSRQIHKSTVKNCGSVWPQRSRGWGATGRTKSPPPRPGGATCLTGLSPS